MAIHFALRRDADAWFATPDGGSEFLVGARTTYADHGSTLEGLFTPRSVPNVVYKAADHQAEFGFWAGFIAPTAVCESNGKFLTVNSYDRAAFTWGFTQFAAHVPDGDFVLWFRDMLTRPDALQYFPDLGLVNGRITKLAPVGGTALESDQTSQPLMDYLNPSSQAVDDAEVVATAKLMHWTRSGPDVQRLQVKHMVTVARSIVAEADRRLNLDGRSADVVALILDIRHQGRGRYADMQAALAASDPLDALLKIGAVSYAARISTLKAAIAKSDFASYKWSSVAQDFQHG